MIGAKITLTTVVFGSPGWTWPAAALALGATLLVTVSYLRLASQRGVRSGAAWVAAGLKLAGLWALILCLPEPLVVRERVVPGAHHLVVLADTSLSLSVHDRGVGAPRSDAMASALTEDAAWLTRAAQDFAVERYTFDARLRRVESFEELAFGGEASALADALGRLRRRFADAAVGGIVVWTDGNATDDLESLDLREMPPVFPVLVGEQDGLRDLAIEDLAVNETAFEETPVILRARVRAVGCEAEPIQVWLADESGTVLLEQTGSAPSDGGSAEFRFEVPRDSRGIRFLTAHAALRDDPDGLGEATTENNRRFAAVHRNVGPYRVLYVGGRPNWEFKFLRRAMSEDREVELVGLLRIAKRKPKFTFRDTGVDRRNTLFKGFEAEEAEIEQYDEPVLLRLGTRDEFELREGFPQRAEDLFAYSAVVLDDLEATFFDPDQQALLEQFVGRRGGGFLALGGEGSFDAGSWERTPLADLLPVYLKQDGRLAGENYRLSLTREGWLEPWVRLRAHELEERERRGQMPILRTMHGVGEPKPGAAVLLEAQLADGSSLPALVTHRFGRGRAAALLAADLWRWDLAREAVDESDLGRSWRQLLRWLVADVPERLEVRVEEAGEERGVTLRVRLRDERFEAEDRASLRTTVTDPDGVTLELDARPSSDEAGAWETRFTPRHPGPHRVEVVATLEDGSTLPAAVSGWVAEPARNEWTRLRADRARMDRLARATGGELLNPSDIDEFAESLVHRDLPHQERELVPLWHRWWSFVLALGLFLAEWTVRRRTGLA